MERQRDRLGRFVWIGDSFSYSGIHVWVNKACKKESCCECGSKDNLDYANISGEYKKDLSDWKVMCKKCHHIFDNVYQKGMKTKAEKKLWNSDGGGIKYKCIECGADGKYYPSLGLCEAHYIKKYHRENKEEIKKYKAEYYKRNRTKILARMKRNEIS